MRNWSGHLGAWVVIIGVVGLLVGALALRGSSLGIGQAPPASTDAVAEASASPTASPRPTPQPTPRPTAEPTPIPATPSPIPATPAPTPVPVAVAPATATPVPVHDNEPAQYTTERVDGAMGQTLTVSGYSVRAVRVSAPAEGQCATILRGGEHFYEITLTYSGPLWDVTFDLGGGIHMSCVDFAGDASQQFPSGVTRTVVIAPGEDSSPSGMPLSVFLTKVNGPHSLWYVFH